MNFEKIIKNNLDVLLNKFGFAYERVSDTIVVYKSDKVSFRFIYSPYEYSAYYFLKYSNHDQEIENLFLEKFLELERPAVFSDDNREQRVDRWIKWVAKYFMKNKDKLLVGDSEFFNDLNKYFINRNKEYNNRLKLDAIKNRINKYWKEKNYRKLASIEIDNIVGLNPSDIKKIEYAKETQRPTLKLYKKLKRLTNRLRQTFWA